MLLLTLTPVFNWTWGIFINMKFIITENKIKDLITKVVGYDLSDRIEIITNWVELGPKGQYLFSDGREEFRWLLNHYGPMYLFHIDGNNYYAQPQKEYGVLVLSEKQNRKIDESDFLNILGIKHLGIGLNYIITNFA
jgi:hypothetical protein